MLIKYFTERCKVVCNDCKKHLKAKTMKPGFSGGPATVLMPTHKCLKNKKSTKYTAPQKAISSTTYSPEASKTCGYTLLLKCEWKPRKKKRWFES